MRYPGMFDVSNATDERSMGHADGSQCDIASFTHGH